MAKPLTARQVEILRVLEECGGSNKAAAHRLGITAGGVNNIAHCARVKLVRAEQEALWHEYHLARAANAKR